jgi:AmmeMemoRadiSam system protein A
MPSLLEADRLALLQLARWAVVEAVTKGSPSVPVRAQGIFSERHGVFVSLHMGQRLRGCIGVLEGREPLGATVVHCAAGAAREDPRFAPVRAEELSGIRVELSILSPLAPLRAEEIVIGVHGLVVAAEGRKGVLLPQVATRFQLDREGFLGETCRKAGLPPDAWRQPQTEILGFTSEVFAEPE